jgi:hypothetical protein
LTSTNSKEKNLVSPFLFFFLAPPFGLEILLDGASAVVGPTRSLPSFDD